MHDPAKHAVIDVPRERVLTSEGLVVLTRDAALIQTLKVLGSAHHIVTVSAESELAGELLAKHTGVVIIDAGAAASPVGHLIERLKSQFPDLVLVVAGRLEDQSALAAQITNGTVYRFLHKPVSEQRVKLFVDAAWRRHEEHAGAADTGMPPSTPHPSRSAFPRNTLIAGGVMLAAFVAWLLMRPEPAVQAPAPGVAAHDEELESLMSRAGKALEAGALVAPPGNNAAQLYRQALLRNDHDSRAAAGLESVIDRLLSAAERELTAQHIDEAQKLTDQARAIQPDHVRVAFLTARIGRERERAVLNQARQAASSGNIEQAIAVLDDAARQGKRSVLVAEARQELERRKLDDRVAEYLGKAGERLGAGQLLEPAQDNAKFYIESARALAPGDPAVRQAERQLADRFVSEARKALESADTAAARPWIEAAADSGASSEDVTTLNRDAQRIQSAAKADAMAHLALAFNQRLTQGRVLEPASDSAKFYLSQLQQADAVHPSTVLAQQAFAARTLDESKAALKRQDFEDARRWLAEAHDAGADDAGIGAVEHDIAAAEESGRRAAEVANAASLPMTHYAPPVFPLAARERGISGWVDIQLVIRPDGSVGDVTITGAQPVGIFEQAAMDAVRKWRYKPVQRDGHAVEQRARLRVKFALDQ